MSDNPIRVCLDKHLIEKAHPGVQVPAEAWLTAAGTHITSARALLGSDPVGSITLSWLSCHNIAKATVAHAGFRLKDETHGKIADFLGCVYGPVLTPEQRGAIQQIRDARNAMTYGDPRHPQNRLVGLAVTVAERLHDLASAVTAPTRGSTSESLGHD